MFESLLKAAVGVVVTPVALVADIATLGGTVNDRRESYTETVVSSVGQNLGNAIRA